MSKGPEEIASRIRAGKSKVYRNLGAFLLRRADGDSIAGTPMAVFTWAEKLGLADGARNDQITQLGRDVAALLRPTPWSATTIELRCGSESWRHLITVGLAYRIAELLTADDLAKAKAYE